MKTSEEIKQYNQRYWLEEKDWKIRRIVDLARDITAHGGGDIKFVKMEKRKNKKWGKWNDPFRDTWKNER